MTTNAWAQETTTLTDLQQAYNEEGVKFAAEGEYAQAVAKFQNSLTLGEANVTWLNIGRTYQRMGECMKAKDAYAKVPTAPAVESPGKADILKFLSSYQKELPKVCPATVIAECDAGQARLDGGEWTACPATFTDLKPGTYTIDAQFGERTLSQQVEVKEGQTETVTLQAPVVDVAVENVTETAEPRTQTNVLPIVIAGAGGAVLLTALVLDFAWLGELVEDAQGDDRTEKQVETARDAQSVNRALFATGGALFVIGTIWYLIDPTTESAPQAQIVDGGATVGWSWIW